MNADIHQHKSRLLDYLEAKGVQIDRTKRDILFSCVNPGHSDKNPSASFYENNGDNRVNCNSCGFKGDIFDCAGALTGLTEFKDKKKDIENALSTTPTATKVYQKPERKPVKKATPVPVNVDKAHEVFTTERILNLGNLVLNKDPKKEHRELKTTGWFPYYNESGLIDLMVVRLEDQNNKKDVLTYYYNSKSVAMKNYPVLIYGRDKLKEFPDLPFLIHEGEKCVDIASDKMKRFVHITWNGGGKKFDQADWSTLKGREGFLLPDDDQKLDNNGNLLPHEKQPGNKTMLGLQKLLKETYGITACIVPAFGPEVREIKPSGADIVEILKVYSPDKITNRILSLRGDRNENTQTDPGYSGSPVISNDNRISGNNSDDVESEYPFKILGVADDGKAYFLDTEDRLVSYRTTEINGNILSDLGTLNYYKKLFNRPPIKADWDEEVDVIRSLSKKIDFDIENLKGRGAWKSKKGDLCYYDGNEVTGTPDPEWTFVRKAKKPIGINSKPAQVGVRLSVMKISKKFTLDMPADNIRLLSWAALAPFGGALNWRPMILATGPSGSGKSTVMDNLVSPISQFVRVNGTTTTEAAIRQYNGIDSRPVYVEEAEVKKPKDKDRIEGIFALGRGGTTDDSPKTIKGSASGAAVVYEMKSMFSFASINASVDNTADDNRIIRINFKEPENKDTFIDDIEEIKSILTPENCDGIRSFTWKNLKNIMNLGERLFVTIQKVTGQPPRFAAGESILLAANMIVWEGWENELSNDFLTEYVSAFYKHQFLEEKRDETAEMINRLLDESVIVGEKRERVSLREMLMDIKHGTGDANRNSDYKRATGQRGLAIHKESNELAIAQNHHEIMKILEIGKGYHRQIERHPNVIHKQKHMLIDTGTRRITVIKNFLDHHEEI